MSDNVIPFPGTTTLDINPNAVLKGAIDQLKMGMVIGYDNDGEFYIAVSTGSAPEISWLLTQAQSALLKLARASDD